MCVCVCVCVAGKHEGGRDGQGLSPLGAGAASCFHNTDKGRERESPRRGPGVWLSLAGESQSVCRPKGACAHDQGACDVGALAATWRTRLTLAGPDLTLPTPGRREWTCAYRTSSWPQNLPPCCWAQRCHQGKTEVRKPSPPTEPGNQSHTMAEAVIIQTISHPLSMPPCGGQLALRWSPSSNGETLSGTNFSSSKLKCPPQSFLSIFPPSSSTLKKEALLGPLGHRREVLVSSLGRQKKDWESVCLFVCFRTLTYLTNLNWAGSCTPLGEP